MMVKLENTTPVEVRSRPTLRPVELGVYRHYKGPHYRVVGTAIDAVTEAQMVLYFEIPPREMWARDFDIFFETVIFDGRSMPRFERIEDDTGAA